MHVFRGIAKTEKIIQPLQPCVFSPSETKISSNFLLESQVSKIVLLLAQQKTRVIESWLNTKTTSKLACCCISILNAPPPVLFGCFCLIDRIGLLLPPINAFLQKNAKNMQPQWFRQLICSINFSKYANTAFFKEK